MMDESIVEPSENPMVEALTEWFGPRCPTVVPGCACCDAWATYDMLVGGTPENQYRGAWNAALASVARKINGMEGLTVAGMFDILDDLALQPEPDS